MKKFIRHIIIFSITIATILSLCIMVYALIYQTPKNIKPVVFLGDSTTRATIDTDILSEYENFSQGGEAYLFSYYKLKKLTETEKIDTLLINFSPSNIINNEYHLSAAEGRSRYLPFIDKEGQKDLLYNKPSLLLKNWIELGGETINYIKSPSITFGGYVPNNKPYVENYYTPKKEAIISDYQKKYLDKIVDFCKTKNIKLIFIDLPKYRYDNAFNGYYRKKFYDLYYNHYSDIDFISFREMDLGDKSHFADIIHISEKGSKKFSKYLKDTGINQLLHSQYNIRNNDK